MARKAKRGRSGQAMSLLWHRADRHCRLVVAILGLAVASAVPAAAHAVQAGTQQAVPAPSTTPRVPPITPLAGSPYRQEILLYPKRADHGPSEQWETYLGGPIVRNVVNPSLIPLMPARNKGNGTAVIYAPGGGFKYLAMQDPGLKQLTNAGITVFLLKYRLETTDRDPPTLVSVLGCSNMAGFKPPIDSLSQTVEIRCSPR